MHLVNESCPKVLANRRHATAHANVFSVGCLGRSFECRLDAVGNKVEGRSSFHHEWRAGVVGQHEHRRMVGWIVTPPASPALVWPGTPQRSEHIPTHDPGADICHRTLRKSVVDTGAAAVPTGHLENIRVLSIQSGNAIPRSPKGLSMV